MKTKRSCEITERDYKILRFLWKWKSVSTMTIAKKFFPDIQPSSAYRRLQYLEQDNYIQSFVVKGRFHEAWALKEKGYKYIQSYLGELKSLGFKSENYRHDFLASAFHLGEWLTHQPSNSQTYSEQQLRCYPEDLWPEWVPRSSLHRPDGYSIYTLDKRNVIIAFEVEMSLKSQDRYEKVVAFYDSQTSIDCVLWLIMSPNMLPKMKTIFNKFNVRSWTKHQFILHADFLKHGWHAEILGGQYKGQKINKIMHPNSVQSASRWHPDLDALALLNSRRRPINSNT